MPVTVLLVDDVRLYLELEKTFLVRHDVRVLTSRQGPQVVALARAERPDVAVVDVRTPDLVGLRVCRDLKADPGTRTIPVIAVTTHHSKQKAREAGADAIVYKPIVQREFLDAVRHFAPFRERRHRRCPVNLRFTFVHGDDIGQAFSRDLSVSGAFLKTDRAFDPGSRLELRFHLPGEGDSISCQGFVRVPDDDGAARPLAPGFGIEFDEMGQDDQLRLERFLERQMNGPLKIR